MSISVRRSDILGVRIRPSARAKRVSLMVHLDGSCEVVIPARRRVVMRDIERFIEAHKTWIFGQQKRLQRLQPIFVIPPKGKDDLVQEATRRRVRELMDSLCRIHGFVVHGVGFRVYRSRWGSCSREKVLQFHAHLSLLPKELVRYVVIHELAHTVHLHHKPSFWRLVESLDPAYLAHRRALRRYTTKDPIDSRGGSVIE